MKRGYMVAFCVVFAAALTVPVWAQSGTYKRNPNSQITGGPKHSTESKNPYNPNNRNNSTLNAYDRTFLNHAAQGGLAEVQLGELAEQKAFDSAVKQFGQRMVHDHTKINEKLNELAVSKGFRPLTGLSNADQQQKDRLTKLSGKQFDKQYIQLMVQDHKKDVAEFQKASTNATDSDIKKFAAETLPILRDHMQLAQQLQKGEAHARH